MKDDNPAKAGFFFVSRFESRSAGMMERQLTAGDSLINDLTIIRDAACFTDARRPIERRAMLPSATAHRLHE